MIVGVDFGAPRRARDQRRKIVAIAAYPAGQRTYRIDASGINTRLLANSTPGWSARELLDELLDHPVRVAGFDFPFSVPGALLSDPRFARDAGYENGAFSAWSSFNSFVARRLPLSDPLDFSPFQAWRDRSERSRLWVRRATDTAAGAQPPLKDKFQVTFQMTLLGNALLAPLRESTKYRVVPFPGGRGAGEVVEVYPGATLRSMGLANYKSRPEEAVRLGIAACAAAGLKLDIDPRLIDLCSRYSSGGKTPDHDVADAFVALCTTILYAEGFCRAAIGAGDQCMELEGVIWVPGRVISAPG